MIVAANSHPQLRVTEAITIPKATVQVFQRGFTISILHESDFDTVRFDGNCGSESTKFNEFAQTQTQPIDGSWTFIDNRAQLQSGDVINYRVFVTSKSRQVGHVLEQKSFVVTGEWANNVQ